MWNLIISKISMKIVFIEIFYKKWSLEMIHFLKTVFFLNFDTPWEVISSYKKIEHIECKTVEKDFYCSETFKTSNIHSLNWLRVESCLLKLYCSSWFLFTCDVGFCQYSNCLGFCCSHILLSSADVLEGWWYYGIKTNWATSWKLFCCWSKFLWTIITALIL